MPIKCTRMAGPSVPAARALGLAVLWGGCVSHSTAGSGSCCTHLVVVLFDLPLKDVRATGEAAVLKAAILTQLLPHLLPLGFSKPCGVSLEEALSVAHLTLS